MERKGDHQKLMMLFLVKTFTEETNDNHVLTMVQIIEKLKLLVDAVQSTKFVTDRKFSELIKKLESLVSRYDAKQLHRQVIISR